MDVLRIYIPRHDSRDSVVGEMDHLLPVMERRQGRAGVAGLGCDPVAVVFHLGVQIETRAFLTTMGQKPSQDP